MSEWQPIETVPKDTTVHIYGWNLHGQGTAKPYKYFVCTVGEIRYDGKADDLLNPGCDCVRGQTVDNPTHWMPLPTPPVESAETAK